MKPLFYKRVYPMLFFLLPVIFVFMVGLACNTPTTESSNQTQVSINVQATQYAQNETLTAEADEAQTQEEEATAEISAQQAQDAQTATQMALDVQATVNAQPSNTPLPTHTAQPTYTPQPADTQGQPQQPPADMQQPAFNQADFEAWLRTANILLFEDMAFLGFVQPALDAMSLTYVDVNDAMGHFKTQLLSGGPGGQGWDLIISAKEARENISGEFYVYLNDALNAGSSVIIEEWDIDDIASGRIAAILGRCGVEFQRDWINIPLDEQLLFPINGENPIHHYPNEGISLTNPSNFWVWDVFDLGDLLRLRPGSDAQLLWGARSAIKDSYATAVVCVDGRLIIQTYGSHSYGQNRVIMMWQNYIYNALQARYMLLQAMGQN